MILIIVIYSYLIGCIQSSYIISKFFLKKDIRTLGNGNAGASNMTVAFGWKLGIIVGILDILKGIIGITITAILFKGNSDISTLKYLSGFFVILGHNYPFFISFKGGKGTASLVGMILALFPLQGLLMVISFVLISIATNYIALGTISLVIIFSVYTFFTASPYSFFISVIIALLSMYKHRINVVKILNKEEKKVRNTIRKGNSND